MIKFFKNSPISVNSQNDANDIISENEEKEQLQTKYLDVNKNEIKFNRRTKVKVDEHEKPLPLTITKTCTTVNLYSLDKRFTSGTSIIDDRDKTANGNRSKD